MRLILPVLLAFTLTGCAQRLVDFTAISTKNVQIDGPRGDKRTVGKDCAWYFLNIPLGVPNMKEAIDRAIESAGTEYNALVDGVVYSKAWTAVVVSQVCYEVEGTPVSAK